MNYLGHLYFSKNNTTLMLNNLYGDFVKGQDLSNYSIDQKEGIILHRKIDNYIDNHPKIKDLGIILRNYLPKVYNISIDLFFDYYLAKNWSKHHKTELNEFLSIFFKSIDLLEKMYKKEFELFIQKLIKNNWISYYPTLFGLHKMCEGTSKRISFQNELKNGLEVFLKFENEICLVFDEFLNEAKIFFLKE